MLAALIALTLYVCVFLDSDFERIQESIRERFVYQWQVYPGLLLCFMGWWQGRTWAGPAENLLTRFHFLLQGLVIAFLPIWMLMVPAYIVDRAFNRFVPARPVASITVAAAILALCVVYLYFAAMTVRNRQKEPGTKEQNPRI
ncbi:MAG: hypothetical protein L6R28_07955 [Planctomycetes bacterium]|nr:hypothetical protein [Planctomycetota bacterium]